MSSNPAGFVHCPVIDRAVSTEQTEGACRDRHNCGGGDCPCAADFVRDWPAARSFDYALGAWSWWFTPGVKRGE